MFSKLKQKTQTEIVTGKNNVQNNGSQGYNYKSVKPHVAH